jgi:hypothetical protein
MIEWNSFRRSKPEKERMLVLRYCCGVSEDNGEDEYHHFIGLRIENDIYRFGDNAPWQFNDLEDWEYLE